MLNLTYPIVDIAIVCSDFQESVRFYHELLGLEIVWDLDIPEELATQTALAPRGFHHIRLRAGNTLIKLMEIESPPPKGSHEFGAGVRWLTFFVDDVKSSYEDLKQKGVTFLTEPYNDSVVCALDPDGLLIELIHIDEARRSKT